MIEIQDIGEPDKEAAGYEEFLQTVSGLAKEISGLHLQLAESQRPLVNQLIAQKSRDTAAIERVLDQLLDSAAHPVGLELLRKLCSYYWTINPQATAEYIQAYRDMWGDDDAESSEERAE
ncbi:hypothetical protein [Rhodopirellula bahusiensis]|uniref:Uncharacterized protein n=1 Tax=Rhodopirellula bahusiensis TaxID=2014065 RepID=A0A2G1W273_9BACT|nr:hypothetical protein [Rhodopirellula bahusiensis]PHQ33147.1 hypothetical protein CEE69_22050 [Rhodopirellula bahusiensis]